ncbi:MAG: 4Fe-4S dicluster domain-containing protein [Eubacterium sp.]
MNNYNDFSIEKVSKQELYDIMQKKYEDGYRLAQICSIAFDGYNEVIYSVTKEYLMENYKIELPVDEEIKSFSDIFPAANLYENEIKELWGVKVTGMALDYDNKFYRISKETPFKKQINAVQKQDAQKEQAPACAGKIVNNIDTCILCGLCARKCPQSCITVDRKEEKTWSINRDDCIQCGACIDACIKFHSLSFAEDDGEKGIVTIKKEDK